MEKITALNKPSIGVRGTQAVTFLYWYTISPRVEDAATPANEIVTTAASKLTAVAERYVDTADQTLLNDGDAGFEQVVREQTGGETNAAFLTRILADHAVREAAWIQEQRDIWDLAGIGRDA